jgi:hypothetical protein
MLADLLRLVETSNESLTCGQLAERLGKDPAVVAGMLDWLSRSGRLHDDHTGPAKDGTCDPSACGVARPACGAACPFTAAPETGRRFIAIRPVSS